MRTSRKILLGIISVLMISLITSTATITVANGDWGNLEAGDEMRWKWWPYLERDHYIYLDVEVLGISGLDLTYRYVLTEIDDGSVLFVIDGTRTEDDYLYYGVIRSQSYLQQKKADAEDDPNETWTQTPHNWKGTNYRTHYIKITSNGDLGEFWYERGTGILLESQWTHDGLTATQIELQSTTASLTRARRFCMGTVLIVFVSVATLVSYSLVKYQKKKKT